MDPSNYLLARVNILPTGAYAIRSLPQSKMRVAFTNPPPTTLMGAFTYSLLRKTGKNKEIIYSDDYEKAYSPMEEIKDIFSAIAIKITGRITTFGTLLRINRMYRKEVGYAVTSLPMAMLFGTDPYEISLLYLFDLEKAKLHDFSEKDLLNACWGVTRLGSKESIVSVEQVQKMAFTTTTVSSAETSYSFVYRDDFIFVDNCDITMVVNWAEPLGNYSEISRIPYVYPQNRLKVTSSKKFQIINFKEDCLILA
ncbi:MAG: type I-A CRISPR-associated protein Cas5 [Candidatus Heimdallarchaeota archaeon]|nr:type I-A CRISPR-associated protein Cas5 [Candidatus Heimdallarchaeota archaeon]